ncbi:MAG: hypothetical protein ACXAEX_18250 [Promethearchaeota archaeon]|jgi:hypothetical protein
MKNRQNIREYLHYLDGKSVTEILLEPRKSCLYYWKALIHREDNGRFRVDFFDKFGKPFLENDRDGPLLFDDIDDAKIHIRRVLLNQ